MEYRVSELAQRSGVSVDTIRFYQGRGLIPMPRHSGRYAIYSEEHLARLRRIRQLLDEGFTLAQIRRVLAGSAAGDARSGGAEAAVPRAGPSDARSRKLLAALVEERVGEVTMTRAELAEASGVPEALITAVEQAGLVEPIQVDGQTRFTQADLEMARAAMGVLEVGLPLPELLSLAVAHAQSVQELAERGIDLFDEHVRKAGVDESVITRAFQELLPQVTRLVALHLQKTIVARALDRLRASGDSESYEHALAATQSGRLEVRWR
jgi:DNA-binding transcriptional MerR regulator